LKPKKLFRPLRGRNSFLGFDFFHAHLLSLDNLINLGGFGVKGVGDPGLPIITYWTL
jgi:hypothetical protein